MSDLLSATDLARIRDFNRKTTKMSNFTEWNSVSHGHVDELLEHIAALEENAMTLRDIMDEYFRVYSLQRAGESR